MKDTLFVNIGRLAGILPQGIRKLCGKDMDTVRTLDNAYLLVRGGMIASFGKMEDVPSVSSDVSAIRKSPWLTRDSGFVSK